MIFSDFLRAVSQVFDPRFLRVLVQSVGLTVGLLALITLGVQWVLPDTVSLPWFGEIGWLTRVLSGFVLIAMIAGSVFLMVPVASLFIGFFLEQIVSAVEAKHYADLPAADPVRLSDSLGESLRLLGLLLVVNLFALMIYLLSTVLAPVIFWIVNGILLGREYFQLVAMRRLGKDGATELRKTHRLQVWMAGFLMAVPLTVPFLNLLVPVVGVATFTHLFHRLNRSDR